MEEESPDEIDESLFQDEWSPSDPRRWVLGVALPAALVCYATYCIWMQHAVFFSRRLRRGGDLIVRYTGLPAVCLACCYLAGALALFSHYFCSGDSPYHAVGTIGKIVALAMLCIALPSFIYCVLFIG